MSTIRAQLTTAYATALIGTVGVFAGVIWTTRREGVIDAQRPHALIEANLALRLHSPVGARGAAASTANRDSLVGAQLDAPLRTMLEGMPDYFSCSTRADASSTCRRPFAISTRIRTSCAALMAAAVSAPTTGVAKTVALDDRKLLLVAQAPDGPALGRCRAWSSRRAGRRSRSRATAIWSRRWLRSRRFC